MFFVATCRCGEKILFRERIDIGQEVKPYSTLMQSHHCKTDGLEYIIEISRGFHMKKPPNPKKEPPEPDPFDADQKGDPTDPTG